MPAPVINGKPKLTVCSYASAAVGTRISGVDDSTYSITGEAFSQIVAADSATHTSRLLQEDDVSLAYEFARKVCIKARSEAIMRLTFGFVWQFPGYTAENLSDVRTRASSPF
jgi:hypothetical protein